MMPCCLLPPHILTLQNLFKLLDRFAHLSGQEVNRHKSEALNVSLPNEELSHIQAHFPFQWATPYLPYLGIKLTSPLAHLYRTNYLPMFSHFTSLMGTWHPLCVSWLGRITAVKMTLLPKILYLFRVLSISIPSYFFRALPPTSCSWVYLGLHHAKGPQVYSPKR